MKILNFVLATWTANWLSYIPCDSLNPVEDPYSGISKISMTSTLDVCFQIKTKKMQRSFLAIEEAQRFLDHCPDYKNGTLSGEGTQCSDKKIKWGD